MLTRLTAIEIPTIHHLGGRHLDELRRTILSRAAIKIIEINSILYTVKLRCFMGNEHRKTQHFKQFNMSYTFVVDFCLYFAVSKLNVFLRSFL